MKEIELKKGFVTLIDDDDFDRVSQHNWHLSSKSYGRSHAVQGSVNGKMMYLHRFIMNPSNDEVVDHIDRNPLNNQKSNLRNCSRSDNQKNKMNKPKTSIYKGVSLCDNGKGFQANIRIEKSKQIYLGYFKTEVEAAFAYNEAAKEHHGEYGLLNDLNGVSYEKIILPPTTDEKLKWLKERFCLDGSITTWHLNKTFIEWHRRFCENKDVRSAQRSLNRYMNMLVEQGISKPCKRIGAGEGSLAKLGTTLKVLWEKV